MGVKKGYFRTRAVLLLLFMAVLFWGCSSGETQPEIQEENKGFDTEEEAVLSYLAGLRDNDFGRMEDTFLDKSRAADIASQYAYLCGVDRIPELASEGYVRLSESGAAKKFTRQLTGLIEETDFAGMEFLGFILPEFFTYTYSTDEYQDNLQRIAEENGGSKLRNQVAAGIYCEGNDRYSQPAAAREEYYHVQTGRIRRIRYAAGSGGGLSGRTENL